MTLLAARPWVAFERQAIGTFVHVLLTDAAALAAAERIVADELDQLDAACSRFRPDSELMQLTATVGKVAVSSVLAGALRAALATAESTDGLVDPTLGGLLRAAGYDRTFASLPADSPSSVPLPLRRPTWREVVVVGDEVLVPTGLELDLGASAKAWAADRIANRLAVLGGGVLVNLGGDLAIAGPAPDGGWPVAVTDRPGGPVVQTVALESGGLATSSTTARTWRRDGELVHHILDPRTGRPVRRRWASVSVCAPTCLQANGLATASVVLGDAAPEWLVAKGFSACLVGLAGDVLRLNGWPEDEG